MKLYFILIILGLFLFILNWVLCRDLSVTYNYISDFVHTSKGLLTSGGFILIGLGILTAVHTHPETVSLLKAELYIFGSLYITLALFPVDKPGKITYKGVIHTVAAHLCFEPFTFTILFLIYIKQLTSPLVILLTLLSLAGGVLMLIFKNRLKGVFQRFSIISQLIIVILIY